MVCKSNFKPSFKKICQLFKYQKGTLKNKLKGLEEDCFRKADFLENNI